jgi:hypothetical protein
VVRPARTVPAVIRRRARVRLGNQELARLGRSVREVPVGLGDLAALVRTGGAGRVDALCFLAVLAADKVVARWRAFRGARDVWAADRTTR